MPSCRECLRKMCLFSLDFVWVCLHDLAWSDVGSSGAQDFFFGVRVRFQTYNFTPHEILFLKINHFHNWSKESQSILKISMCSTTGVTAVYSVCFIWIYISYTKSWFACKLSHGTNWHLVIFPNPSFFFFCFLFLVHIYDEWGHGGAQNKQ